MPPYSMLVQPLLAMSVSSRLVLKCSSQAYYYYHTYTIHLKIVLVEKLCKIIYTNEKTLHYEKLLMGKEVVSQCFYSKCLLINRLSYCF